MSATARRHACACCWCHPRPVPPLPTAGVRLRLRPRVRPRARLRLRPRLRLKLRGYFHHTPSKTHAMQTGMRVRGWEAGGTWSRANSCNTKQHQSHMPRHTHLSSGIIPPVGGLPYPAVAWASEVRPRPHTASFRIRVWVRCLRV